MYLPLAEILHNWHDFFLLLGTASATLVGLMFVAASVGAHVFKEENRPALEVFLGPTVVHFTSVLVVCILGIIPSHTWLTFAGGVALMGLAGMLYSAKIWLQLIHHRFDVDVVDQLFYTLLPALGYLLVLLAAWLLYTQSEFGFDAAAAALVTLLLAGIRNAWDMTLWIVLKSPGVEGVRKEPAARK